MRDVMQVLKALSDENRVRALMALCGGELCVCQIIALLGLAPSTVSKHMAILRQARLIEGRKEGRWMHYRLAADETTPVSRSALAWLRKHVAGTAVIRKDRAHLAAILRQAPEALCAAARRDRPGPATSPGHGGCAQ